MIMDAIKLNGLDTLFDSRLTSEITPVLKSSIPPQAPQPKEDIATLVENINSSLSLLKTTLRFSVDNESNVFYVAVIDTQTNEMLRRFPLDELPKADSLQYKKTGIFLNTVS